MLLFSVYDRVCMYVFFLPFLLLKVRTFFKYVRYVSIILFFKKGDGIILLITTVLHSFSNILPKEDTKMN